MPVLLLRLAAPLQAWGCGSKYEIRYTEREPTKSGVIGMIAAALGVKREKSGETLAELSKLNFGVRVEREGKLIKDFHIVQAEKKPYVTERYYLSDAVFLAALETENIELLERIENTLRSPVYPLFLGRRSCPPTLPIVKGIRDGSLVDVLKNEPSLVRNGNGRIVYDVQSGGVVAQDTPVSFSQLHRKHSYRMKKEEPVILKLPEHNPMNEL